MFVIIKKQNYFIFFFAVLFFFFLKKKTKHECITKGLKVYPDWSSELTQPIKKIFLF